MKIEILTAGNHLVSAVLNGVYQGLIVAALVGIGLRLIGKTNAATRHTVWFATLLLLVVIIPAHCLRDQGVSNAQNRMERITESLPAQNSSFATVPLPPAPAPVGDATADSIEPAPSIFDPGLAFQQYLRPDEADAPDSLPAPVGEIGRVEAPINLLSPTQISTASLDITDSVIRPAAADVSRGPFKFHWGVSPVSWKLPIGSRFPRALSLVLLAAWLAVAVARITILIWRLFQLRKLKDASFPPGGVLNELFQNLRAKLGVRREVKLKVSSTHRSPVLLGFVHPVILLPTEEATGEVEHVLSHELAHVRRRDDWLNLIQHFIQAALFFHPGVWWISRQLSLEREIACDDYVLRHGCRPQAYALLLANLASRMKGRAPLLAPAASTTKSQLQQRINMILNTQRNTSPRLAKTRLGFITSTAVILAVAAIYSGPRLVLAQSETPSPAAIPAPAAPGDAIEPLAAPPAPALELVSGEKPDTAPRAPGDLDPGPKFKPGQPPEPDEFAPLEEDNSNFDQPGKAPRPPRPARNRKGDSSLEERLDRLERMVESLMAQQKRGTRDMNFEFKDGDGKVKPGKIENFNRDNKAEAAEQNKRAAEKAAKWADEEKRSAEKAAKQEEHGRAEAQMKEASQRELEALRHARESLQREIEKLNRQIERLEQGRRSATLDFQPNGGIAVAVRPVPSVSPVPQANVEFTTGVGVQSDIAVNVKPVPQVR